MANAVVGGMCYEPSLVDGMLRDWRFEGQERGNGATEQLPKNFFVSLFYSSSHNFLYFLRMLRIWDTPLEAWIYSLA